MMSFGRMAASTKSARLSEIAQLFHRDLQNLKKETPLPGVAWYPWPSLAGMDVLDQFLGGSTEALQAMVGSDPVLDVGCGDGDVAYFLESLGIQVDAVDNAPTNYNAMLGVQALKQTGRSSVGIYPIDLDSRPELPKNRYGLAIMLGVLYHLKNPFLVLETLARHARCLFMSTRIASVSPDRKTAFGHLPVAYLVDRYELNNDVTNFWIFSAEGLRRILQRAGWEVTHFTTMGPDAGKADPVSAEGDVRAYVLARSQIVNAIRSFELREGWHALESDAFRWTERRFSLIADVSAALAPATLRLHFRLNEALLARYGNVRVSATVNGVELPARIYSEPGLREYTAGIDSVPAGAVRIGFELDHALAPGEANPIDLRELGLIVDFGGAQPLSLQ